ncbi:MAG: hypothetical protein WC788_02755 [Candidatus Paceibacterota bacterium]|jgi:hypothetical protein
MSIFDRFFKKEEEHCDILEQARKDIASKALWDLHVLRSTAYEEAVKIIEWCTVAQKKNDPSDHVDAAVMLMSYCAASSSAILKEIKKLSGSQAGNFEQNLYGALGKIDILYDENDHIKRLKAKRAEVYYLFGNKPSYRIKKSAQLLAACIVSSENLDAARALYRNENFTEEVKKQLKEEMSVYDENIVKEIIEEK